MYESHKEYHDLTLELHRIAFKNACFPNAIGLAKLS